MRKQGTLRRWDDVYGFGFIDSGSSRDVFVHARDFARGVTPAAGMQVSFEEIHVGGKGPRAMDVQASASSPTRRDASTRTPPKGTPSERQPPRPAAQGTTRKSSPPLRSAPATGSSLIQLLMVLWLLALLAGAWLARIPWMILGAIALLNVVTYVIYYADKSAAQQGSWRTSERTLHLLSLLGGWPAAWWAQQSLRHKSSKHEFRVVYWGTVGLNCLGVGVLLFHPGANAFLRNVFF